MKRQHYKPSVEEISQACEAIRSNWNEQEHRRRAGWNEKNSPFARWSPPQCSARDLGMTEDGGHKDD